MNGETIDMSEAVGGGGAANEQVGEMRVIHMSDFKFENIDFGKPLEGKARLFIPRYDPKDGTPPFRPAIQFPELESPWGFSHYAKENTYSVTHNLHGANGKAVKEWLLKLEEHVKKHAIDNRRAWWPKGPHEAAKIEFAFDSSVRPSPPGQGFGPLPDKFKAKIKSDDGTHLCGGYIADVDNGTLKPVPQSAWQQVFKKGIYFNVLQWACTYLGAKSWGNSWSVVDLCKVKRAGQVLSGAASAASRPPVLLLPEGMSHSADPLDLDAEIAEVSAQQRGRGGDDDDGGY